MKTLTLSLCNLALVNVIPNMFLCNKCITGTIYEHVVTGQSSGREGRGVQGFRLNPPFFTSSLLLLNILQVVGRKLDQEKGYWQSIKANRLADWVVYFYIFQNFLGGAPPNPPTRYINIPKTNITVSSPYTLTCILYPFNIHPNSNIWTQ